MSPASSGTLEVEKYIGACLITQQRPKARDAFYPNYPNYVNYRVQRCGGVPLISFATQKRSEEGNPLARLAVHTQGAPLILTKNFNRRKKKNEVKKDGVDTVSVASDESSGSANSDNCLPRIIKPRKRRKKDRKPPRCDDFSTDSASPDIDPVLHQYTPFIFDPHFGLLPDPPEEESPQLHHSFEDVEESDGLDINGNQTVCQCRYCDPSGQIWDVDRSCYSPFLTTPKTFFDGFLSSYTQPDCLAHGLSSMSLQDKKSDSKTLASSSSDLEVSTEIVTSLNGHRDIEIKFFSSSSADSVRALPKNRDRILTCVNKECTEGRSDLR